MARSSRQRQRPPRGCSVGCCHWKCPRPGRAAGRAASGRGPPIDTGHAGIAGAGPGPHRSCAAAAPDSSPVTADRPAPQSPGRLSSGGSGVVRPRVTPHRSAQTCVDTCIIPTLLSRQLARAIRRSVLTALGVPGCEHPPQAAGRTLLHGRPGTAGACDPDLFCLRGSPRSKPSPWKAARRPGGQATTARPLDRGVTASICHVPGCGTAHRTDRGQRRRAPQAGACGAWFHRTGPRGLSGSRFQLHNLRTVEFLRIQREILRTIVVGG